MRRLVWVALLVCGFASTDVGASTLADRARSVLDQSAGAGAAHRQLLASYADSLRGGDLRLAARCLEVAGIHAFRANRLDEALDFWKRGVEWAREGDSPPAESSLLNALAIGYTVRGDVESALPVYDRALDLRTAMSDSLGLSRTWGNLAQAYTNLGRNAEALAATAEEERWLAVVENPRGRVSNAIRRAQLLGAMGRLLEAKLAAERAVALADDDEARGIATMAEGNALLDLGDYDRALERLRAARDWLTRAGDDYSVNFVRQSIVHCLLRLGRNENALDEAREALAAVETAGHDPLATVLRRGEAHALFALGEADAAEALLRVAVDSFEARRASLQDQRSRAGIFQSSGELYAALARCLQRRNETVEAMAAVERGRAALFRDRSGRSFDLAALQERLQVERATLLLFTDPGFDPLAVYVVTPTNVQWVELGAIEELTLDARATLRLLAAGETIEDCRPALERLSRHIVRPWASLVGARSERLYVVAPSALIGFPLELLELGEGESLGQRWPLSYLPNATSLTELAGRAIPSDGVFAFADPTAQTGPATRLPSSSTRAVAGIALPEARAEIHDLDDVVARASDLRTGASATGASLREVLSRPAALVHLATHSIVDATDGGRSAIVLAGPDLGADAVTAAEIASLEFDGDLVVLSGCSTFGRDRMLGEGWFGLPRAFLGAGARSVLSTLWDVDDVGARRFVELFYDGLREGLPRDHALTRAREHARAEGMAPREWAAFVLCGAAADQVPVLAIAGPAPRNTVWPLALAALALVALVLLGRRLLPA